MSVRVCAIHSTAEAAGRRHRTAAQLNPVRINGEGVTMREPQSARAIKHIGVIGACGGAGASSVAAALARERGRSQDITLVDLADCVAGLDVLLGVEELPGVRWADLGEARGEVSGRELVELLPRWGQVAVLSTDRTRPVTVSPQVRGLVLPALSQVSDLVIDLGGGHLTETTSLCDLVFIVVPRHVRAVAGAQAVVARLTEAGVSADAMALLVRGPAPGGLDPFQVEQVLNVPLAAHMRADRGLAAAVERGVGPQGKHLNQAARQALTYAARSFIPAAVAPRGLGRPAFGRAA